MANLYTIPPGQPAAHIAATHLLATIPTTELARAVLLLPTRRACVTMRQAFQQALAGRASLLPRMFPLADMESDLLTLLGANALALMQTIPPAMPDWQRRYLLTAAVSRFETGRLGSAPLDHALTLADELMALQDRCTRAGIKLTAPNLRALAQGDFAEHWEQSLNFLAILSDYWPELERTHGLTTSAAREVAVLEALAAAWRTTPPDFPVYAIGSTASQPATAKLLHTIAELPTGTVILPGLDSEMASDEWQTIAPGHPLYHLKHFLDQLLITPNQLKPLQKSTRSVWLTALAATDSIPQWHTQPLPPYDHLHLIPCAHAEEEARTITLLLREGLEVPPPACGGRLGGGSAAPTLSIGGEDSNPSPQPSPACGRGNNRRIALVTPDESLMARVAAHLLQYGIIADRLTSGTLASTETGSLWQALTAAIREPDRLLTLRSLLHHPLLTIDRDLLTQIEPYWYGTPTHRPGQLPRLPEALRAHPALPPLQKLTRELSHLAHAELTASVWIERLTTLLSPFAPQAGQGADAIADALDTLTTADLLGPLDIESFNALLTERLAEPWRNPGLASHPRIFMLTPVEARLADFDRIILANMQERVWPGLPGTNAWLNLAAEKSLGLPPPEENITLMAHDMLMLASSGEVFLTYPLRDAGSPTVRSRFIERLVTLLATHNIPESAITATHYTGWAQALHAAASFTPAEPPSPRPPSNERPRILPVSSLDRIFTDPFSIYARHVLNLKPLGELDGEPAALDFGSLAHQALQALTEHWNEHQRPAEEGERAAIAENALRNFAERPNVALFWRRRLLRALDWVNALEAEQRLAGQTPVQTEHKISAGLDIGAGERITLHGRIDRLEQNTVIDYKTGDAPTESQIREGEALQLLAYAMLLEAAGEATPSAIAYWSLPHGRKEGKVTALKTEELAAIPAKLREALATMLHPDTPFLARPVPSNADRYDNDYDGISRYDEWAG